MAATKPTNKLAYEKSPYLLQHATNPVAWFPWGEEAFTRARVENKPIFLSIGYSTCHWCHVMAHESFENDAIAAQLNLHFINIKVDREERPDVDAIYMMATQALTGSGGWPMSVWLTPDLKPFFAGTYFAPDDRGGRVGFPSVIQQLAEVWQKENGKVLQAANQISDLIKDYQQPGEPKPLPMAEELRDAALGALVHQFDATNGGFGQAPKFPMPVYLEFLLDTYRATKSAPALEMASYSMKKMAAGGIYDQLGGGFSRYSTDEKWLVPHFEKMFYDNAQLLSVIAGLYDLTQSPFWKNLALDTASYLFRDLRHKDGGFFSAEDADSEGKEGTFYVWTIAHINKILPADLAQLAIEFYDLTIRGNFFDPHTGDEGQNVLSRTKSIDRTDIDAAKLEKVRAALFKVRAKRLRPHRDEKVITEWNGLMISALSRAARFLQEPNLLLEAVRTVEFIRKHLYDAADKKLYRRWFDGHRAVDGQQSDFAVLIQGLLDMADAGETSMLEWAFELQTQHDKLFFDEELGGYFMTAARPDLILRMKDDTDNVIPSGNSVAVMNGLRLATLRKDPRLAAPALKTLRAFSARLSQHPTALTRMNVALSYASNLGLIHGQDIL